MKYWTSKELARLEQVCKEPGYFAQYLSEFPGRTTEALRRQAQKQGWKKDHAYPGRPPVSQERVMKLLSKRDLCRSEIARSLGIAKCTATDILQRLRVAGKVYASEKPGTVKVWRSCEREAREVLRASPFAVAAGMVDAPAAANGRVYRQPMNVMDDELEAA